MITVTERYRVKVGGKWTIEDIANGDGYARVHKEINSENFPAASNPEPERVDKIIIPPSFDVGMDVDDVLKLAEKTGLLRPTYEHGLKFGIQQPKACVGGPIIFPFLHRDSEEVKFMVIWNLRDGLVLELERIRITREGFRFAFVEP